MKKPLVSIIIVNWNGGNVFRECLQSLNKIDYPNWELIVVDNGSSDGSEKYPETNKIIINKKNVGFAPANNQGVKQAKGKYVLLLNNDTKVATDFLTKMVKRMEKDSKIGALQPKIYIMDKRGYLDNAGSFFTRTGLLQHWGYMKKDGKEFSKEKEIFSAKGACMLVKKSLIEKIGLFDKTFVSYFEESDFCWRVWLSGHTVLFYPDAKIYHKVGYTSSKLSPEAVSFNSNKNRLASLFKNLSVANLVTILIPHMAFLSLLGLYYALRLRFSQAWMIYKSLLWFLFNLLPILKKRKVVQKGRAVSDSSIFDRVGRPVNVNEMFNHFSAVEKNFS